MRKGNLRRRSRVCGTPTSAFFNFFPKLYAMLQAMKSPAQAINERLTSHQLIMKAIIGGRHFRLIGDRRPYRYWFVQDGAHSFSLMRDGHRIGCCSENHFYIHGFLATIDLLGEQQNHSVLVQNIRILKEEGGAQC